MATKKELAATPRTRRSPAEEATDEVSPTPSEGQAIDDPLVSLARANAALAAGVVASAFVGLRLLAITDFRPDVSVAVLSSAGIGNAVLGSVLSLLPFALPLVAMFLWDIALDYYAAERRALPTLVAALFAVMISLLVSPWPLLGFLAAAVVATSLWGRIRSARGRPIVRRQEAPMALGLLALGLPLLYYTMFIPTPWLPPEELTVSGRTFVGYVTDADSRWVHVLTEQPRVLVVVESTAIETRVICDSGSIWTKSVLQVLLPSGEVPPCPAS